MATRWHDKYGRERCRATVQHNGGNEIIMPYALPPQALKDREQRIAEYAAKVEAKTELFDGRNRDEKA